MNVMSEHIVWHDWAPLAFRQAAEKHRPVLLSLVTAWSDECAAMDRTTFAHPDVVALVEERFVPVRVDADRRPDLNDRYNLGGWPTTVFLTKRRGCVEWRHLFRSVDAMIATLGHVADAYRDRADELAARACVSTPRFDQTLSHVVSGFSRTVIRLQPDRNLIDYFRSLLIERFDPVHGGFGSAAKLPHPYALLFALSLAGGGDAELRDIVELTLDRMCALWDSSSGGFFRYAGECRLELPRNGEDARRQRGPSSRLCRSRA